uniref:DUF7083 domain-containing protein n=1 Tax=Caenorhabditis japonica TaxID=281687 RepID=A0A8R1I466_CAEJA
MSKENEEFMLRMMRMFEKQNEQHQAAMTALVQAMTSKSNDESRADMTPTTSGVSQTQLMNDIGSRVAMFQFDLETEKTFSKWYARHEAAFTVEHCTLHGETRFEIHRKWAIERTCTASACVSYLGTLSRSLFFETDN